MFPSSRDSFDAERAFQDALKANRMAIGRALCEQERKARSIPVWLRHATFAWGIGTICAAMLTRSDLAGVTVLSSFLLVGGLLGVLWWRLSGPSESAVPR